MNAALKNLLFGAFLIVTTSAQVARAQVNAATPITSDREAVKLVMQNFIRSFETGDVNLMRSTFRSDGWLVGYSKSKGQVVTESTEEWSKGFTGKPPEDEALRKRSFEILDVTETGAVSKAIFDYPTWTGIDYIALSKIEGKWMIISKSWSGKVKPAAKP